MPPALLLLEALPAIIAGTAPLDLAAGSALGAGALGAMGAGSIGALLTGTALGSTLLQVGLSVGLSYVSQLLAGSPSVSQQSMQVTSNESTAARVRVYGRVKISGSRLFWANLSGTATVSDGFGGTITTEKGRTAAIYHCDGPIDAIEEIWFGDEKATFTAPHAAGNWGLVTPVETPMSGHATIQSFRGTGSQTHSEWLAGLAPSSWGVSDKAAGCCYTIANYASVDAGDYLNTYKSNEPLLRAVIRGARVWDPRDPDQNPDDDWYDPTTWTWSDNSSLCILDYLRHPDGRNKPLARIDVPSFSAFADVCYPDIPLKHGGTEPRYRLWGAYGLADEPSAVMRKFLGTCDGELYLTPSGKIAIRGGVWTAPSVIYAQDSILSWSLSQGVGRMAAYNTTTVTYMSPLHDYQMVEADPWIDATSVEILGPLDTSLQLECVPSPSQARRLAKIAARKANPEWKGTIGLDVTGLDVLSERAMTTAIDEMDLVIDVLIQKVSITSDLSAVTTEVITLSPSAYDWDPASEEGEAPPVVPSADVDDTVPTPVIASAVVESGAIGGIVVGSVTLTVSTPSDLTLGVLFRWQKTGSGIWTQATAVAGTWSINTGALEDDQTYDFEAMFYATSSKHSDWSEIVTRTIVADPSPPGVPVAPSLSSSGVTAVITATAPNSSNVRALGIWRGTTDFASATRVGTVYVTANQTISTSDTPGTGTWSYWITAENASGVRSAAVATVPSSITL